MRALLIVLATIALPVSAHAQAYPASDDNRNSARNGISGDIRGDLAARKGYLYKRAQDDQLSFRKNRRGNVICN